MKTNIAIRNGCIRNFRSAAAVLGLFLLAGSAGVCQAAPPPPASPVGTWDIFFSGGGRVGLANITFAGDSTFAGYEIMAPKQPGSSQASGRPGAIGSGVPSSNTNSMGTNIFGFETVLGPWGFDSKGRVIGSWVELTPANTCVTNTTITATSVTNGNVITVTLSTNTSVNCDALTNQVSFVGTVVPGKRLTLVASTSTGKVTYRGVPNAPLPDISGQWYGYKNEQKQSFLEFFTLTPDGLNTYDFVGSGPGGVDGEYIYSGFAMVSKHKKMAFASQVIYPTVGSNILSSIGSFNPKSVNAQTKGIEIENSGGGSFQLTFKATRSAVAGP